MEEWKYNFKPVSKSEWLRVIEEELKGKSIETLQSQYGPSSHVLPLHHVEDAMEGKVILPDAYFTRAPLLMEYFDASDLKPEDVNKQVLQSLQSGAQSIVFHQLTKPLSGLEIMLQDVHTDMIEIGLAIDNPSLDLMPEIPETFSNKIQIRLAINEQTVDEVIDLLHQGNWNNSLFVFTIPNKENWIIEVVHAFERLIKISKDIKEGEESFFERCVFILEPDENYFKQIMQTRALQLVWLNFRIDNIEKVIPNSPIEVHIKELRTGDPDKFLIRASSASLAGALTGVKGICIHHSQDQTVPYFYKRIHRNIHHLLNVESNIYRGRDPLAGSYTIDYYTRDWATAILEQLDYR